MEQFVKMPIEFQVGAVVALGFFILSWILLFFKRGTAMAISSLVSFLVYMFYCSPPIFISILIYGVICRFQVNLFTKAMAREQIKKEWQLYSSDYETVYADPFEFTWLNIDYYDNMQWELESLGFYKVRDSELLPQTKAFPEVRTFSRVFNNAEKDIGADITQIRAVKPRNVFERMIDARIVSFSTEFSDGTFLETMNTLGVNPIKEVEGIVMKQFPPDMPVEELLDAHETEIETICETKNVEVVLHRSEGEISSAGEREFLLFRLDRQKKGGLTAEEVEENKRTLFASPGFNKDGEAGAEAYYEEYVKQTRKFARRERKKE